MNPFLCIRFQSISTAAGEGELPAIGIGRRPGLATVLPDIGTEPARPRETQIRNTSIYITATYFRDYGRFLFIFVERTAAVSPAQQNAGQGSAAGINPYTANDLVIYDIPTEVYTMFRSEDGFREALYVYLTEQGIYTDTVVAGEWYEINGDTASFVL